MRQKFNPFILFIFLLVSCNKMGEQKHTQQNASTIIEARGYSVAYNNIKEPKTIVAGAPTIIKVGEPNIRSVDPYQGEAGGVSIMQNYTMENGLVIDALAFGHRSSICDKAGNLWFGTYSGGVSKYDGKSFTNFTTSQGLANNIVRCILEDKFGNIWFGTDDGASKYNGHSFINFTTNQGLVNNNVRSIIEDKWGNIWFGTGGGVSKYDGNRVDAIEKKNSVTERAQNDLKTINGKLIKSFTNFTTSHGLANNNVRSIIEDKLGNIWFGTQGGGVSRYDGNRVEAIERGNTTAKRTQQDIKKINGKLVKSFTNYSLAHGLTDTIVYCMLEDKIGNIWFGTATGGVIKYDGNRVLAIENGDKFAEQSQQDLKKINGKLVMSFTDFPNDKKLTNYGILCITEDKTGNIWFGSEGMGVIRYNGIFFTYFSATEGLSNNVVLSITEDKAGNLWFGTQGGGVSKYVGKSFTNYTTTQGLDNNLVFSIMEDKTGDLWFSTYAGLSKYNGNVIATTEREKEYAEKLYCTPKKPNVKQLISFTNYPIEHGKVDKLVFTNMLEDKMGNIWFGTIREGVFKYNSNRIRATQSGCGLPSAKDLEKINDNHLTSFSKYASVQGLTNNAITCIAEDAIGNIWFGTKTGIIKYDGNRIEAIERGDKFAQQIQHDLKTINGKQVKSFTHYTTEQGLANNVILSIKEDMLGNLWFGSKGGVIKYDGNRVDAIEAGNKFAAQTQQDLKKLNGKLIRSFTNYTTADGLANNIVNSIAEDNIGNIWFGTQGGLSIYDGNRIDAIINGDPVAKKSQQDLKKINGRLIRSFTNYSTLHGLPDNNVTQILIDPAQNIIIATNFGIAILPSLSSKYLFTQTGGLISKSSLSNLYASYYLNNKVQSNDNHFFEIYNSTTGYPLKDIRTIYKDSKGIIWIATGSDKIALERFDYNALSKNTSAPKVIIQNIKISGETVNWYDLTTNKYDSATIAQQEIMSLGKLLTKQQRDSIRTKFDKIQFTNITKFYPLPQSLVLPYNYNSINFEFAAIEPARPNMVRYQYMLEGYDQNWHFSDKTTITFGNMHEGKYTFKLKAQNPEGIWSEPLTYSFEVLPPLYRTWWAYGSYLIISSSLLYTLLLLRTASLRKDKEILEQAVKERTAEAIFQKEKAEKSAKIKEDFLSNMSHEIRTPLNAITGYTGLIMKEELPEKLKKNLKAVKLSSDHLRRLVDDVLDIAKIESGKLSLHKTDFDLEQLIEEVKLLLYFKALEKGNIIYNFVSGSISRYLYGDKDRLVQILINLIDNAIKFTSNGTITITVEQVKREDEKINVLFKVSDTGIGIPAHKMDSIFESFTQAENNISRKYAGTGLGLTISKKIIELQGGEIKVTSTENQGSVFSFTLPYSKGTKPITIKEGKQLTIKNRPTGLHVIAAEDDLINQDLLAQVLEKWDINVDFAETGERLIELLQINTYHLVLLDIHMPGMNGFDVAKAIRTEFSSPINNIPIIALTADVLPSTREKIIRSGINDYVYKPIDYKILHAKMDHLLGLKPELLQTINTEKRWDFTTQYLNLTYLTNNYGANNNYKLKVLSKSCNKLNEYTIALLTAYKNKNCKELLFFAHRLKTIAGILGVSSIQEKLSIIHQLIIAEQPFEIIAAELDAIDQDTKMTSKEIAGVIEYILKNQLL